MYVYVCIYIYIYIYIYIDIYPIISCYIVSYHSTTEGKASSHAIILRSSERKAA